MRIKLQRSTIRTLEPTQNRYEVADTEIPPLRLRITPAGVKTFILLYRNKENRQRRFTIGRFGDLTPEQAREIAKIKLAEIKLGGDPSAEKKEHRKQAERDKHAKLGEFLTYKYEPWAAVELRSGKATTERIRSAFADYLDMHLSGFSSWIIEKWRRRRLKQGRAVSTVNRDVASLRACLAKAVEWDVIQEHPLAKVKLLKVDKQAVVRYLSVDEETRLREALASRDSEIRAARESGNQWRKERGRELMPVIETDHLTPMVILSLNTGMRRGEVFNLHWEDVDLAKCSLTIHGKKAKSGQTRHIPLNAEAMGALKRWQSQGNATAGLVFQGKEGRPFDNCNKAWKSLLEKAGIENFRWHDMRHHFASRLVMAGVDLNTVRELLGHADLKMTLRYAHLAPEHKAAAVAKLVEGRRV